MTNTHKAKNMKLIPYGRQYVDKDDIKAVVDVLKSDWLTQGPKVKEFEDAICKYTGAKHTVAVSSGTAALHLACLAIGLSKGDEAITTPITFLATPNSVFYTGARPVFADIDYNTVNIDPDEIRKKITPKTKAILPVHFAGLPCDMPEIYRIAKKNKIKIIEDACHALGAEYKHSGKWVKVGSCRHSDMTVFSFHPVKHITTGEGGAITTNNKKLYDKLCALRSHGVYRDKKMAKEKGPWYYEMRDLGFNYRMTDFQGALGVKQLERIEKTLKSREIIAKRYKSALKDLQEAIILPVFSSGSRKHAWHLFVLRLKHGKVNVTRRDLFKVLVKKGIFTQVHYMPVYTQPFYRKLGYSCKELINAEKYYKECISLPDYYGLTSTEQDYVIHCLKETLKD
jgi:perosamine synthetase